MKIAFFSTKPYDKTWFEPLGKEYGFEIQFIEYPFFLFFAFLRSGLF